MVCQARGFAAAGWDDCTLALGCYETLHACCLWPVSETDVRERFCREIQGFGPSVTQYGLPDDAASRIAASPHSQCIECAPESPSVSLVLAKGSRAVCTTMWGLNHSQTSQLTAKLLLQHGYKPCALHGLLLWLAAKSG